MEINLETPKKASKIVLKWMPKIEAWRDEGFTREQAFLKFKNATGTSITFRTFTSYVARYRSQSRILGNGNADCIAQSNPKPNAAPHTMSLASTGQQSNAPHSSNGELLSPIIAPSSEPWKPKKRFNPIGAIEEMKKRGQI